MNLRQQTNNMPLWAGNPLGTRAYYNETLFSANVNAWETMFDPYINIDYLCKQILEL